MDFSSGFLAAFWEASVAVPEGVPFVWPVQIDGRPYVVDLSRYSFATLPAVRPGTDTGAEGGEQSLSVDALWRRAQLSWHEGAAQVHFDDIPPRSRMRFDTSVDLDVWTPRRLSILPAMTQRRSSVATALRMLTVGDHLYGADGTTLFHLTDPTASTWSPTVVSGTSGTITSIATDGSYVYAVGSALYRTAVGSSTASQFGTSTPTAVFFANGRLITATDNKLSEVDSTGTATDIWTHPVSGWRWVSVIGTPTGIFAAGSSSDRSIIYHIPVAQTGQLGVPKVASPLPAGERVNAMEAVAGLVVIATNIGIRLAQASGDVIFYGPATSTEMSSLVAEGRFVWAGGKTGGLVRLDLSTFTSTLVPAWAPDLSTPTGEVQSVVRKGGRTYAAVSGSGFWGQSGQASPRGTLTTSEVNFGTFETKQWVRLELATEPLPTGGKVTASVTWDDGTTTLVGSYAETGGTSASFGLQKLSSTARFTITLEGGAVLRHWAVYTIPAPRQVTEIICPVVLRSSVIADEQSVPLTQHVLSELHRFLDIHSTRRIVTYQQGADTFSVRIDRIQLLPFRWSDDRRALEATCMLRLLTVS